MRSLVFFLLLLLVGCCLLRAEANTIEIDDFLSHADILDFDRLSDTDAWRPPSARHVTLVIVGSHYFPVICEEMSSQIFFTFWDEVTHSWSYPDSVSSDGAGYGNVWADHSGNLHFVWHQDGNPDGYEIYYTTATLDTSSGIVQYNVQRPPVMISSTDGEEEGFPSLCLINESPFVIWDHGPGGDYHAIYYYFNGNGGVAYEHGSPFSGSWLLCNVAPDLSSGDAWGSLAFDSTGDGSMDLLALHYDATDTSWSIELVAAAPSMHPFCLPGIAVDLDGVAHIVFQENLTNTGGIGGLSGWPQCGPAGSLYYTGRIGGIWSNPLKLLFPRCQVCNFEDGPSGVGITDYCIYFATTQPESASPDTGAYLPFQVFYGCYDPYADTLCYGGRVDENQADSISCAYPHVAYCVPYSVSPSGPGIAWGEGEDAGNPFDVRYRQMPLVCPQGIEEGQAHDEMSRLSLNCSPNPFREKTEIRFVGDWGRGRVGEGEIHIYGLSGRLVRKLVPCDLCSCVLSWDGCDDAGQRVAPGVYFVKMIHKGSIYTKKLVILK